MARINPEMETFAKIKAVGVGGAGGNALKRMIDSNIKGVEFVAVNTDAQDLHHSKAKGIESLLNDELLKQSIIHKGKTRLKQFDWNKSALELELILNRQKD